LADDVIVMQSGKIVASGTSLRLKSELGKGYRLTLTSPSEPTTTKPPVASATLETVKDGQIIWRIENAAELGQVVRWANEMEKNGKKEEEHGIQIGAWEISMPTLEDVLLEKKLF
jgi:ABC-type multidrug transport system ATPase subunit